MHEFPLTNSVNNAVLRLCDNFGWDKVRRILIKVGGMRKINPELMSCIFAIVSRGTATEGADLSIMCLPFTLRCKKCGRKSSREDLDLKCPLCGSTEIEIISGLELSIEALEVEKK